MEAPPNMAPLLDRAALLGFASHIIQMRNRLARRYGEYQPNAAHLAIALYVHMEQSDKARLDTASSSSHANGNINHRPHTYALPSSSPSPSSVSSTRQDSPGSNRSPFSPSSSSSPSSTPRGRKPSCCDLERYLRIAHAAYATTEYELASNVRRLSHQLPNFDGGEGVLKSCIQSDTYKPAYYVMFEHFSQTLIVCIRGSYQTADMVTDLAADSTPFLTGTLRAHKGIAKSAVNVHASLRPFLAQELARRNPRGGLVVTGHSLGAATGAALTMLLRRDTLEYPYNDRHNSAYVPTPAESATASKHLRRTKCFSFAPPPFIHEHHGLHVVARGIVTVVNGWDFVPRCSVSSVNRLVDTCAHLDYTPTLQSMTETATQSVAQLFMSNDQARSMARSVSSIAVNTDAAMVCNAVRSVSAVRAARSPSSSAGSLFVSAVTNLVTSAVENNIQRRRSSPAPAGPGTAGQLASRDLQLQANGETDMVLVGDIWHLEREFTNPSRSSDGGVDSDEWQTLPLQLPRSRLVPREASFFRDIEMCTWMRYDHLSKNMLIAVETLLH